MSKTQPCLQLCMLADTRPLKSRFDAGLSKPAARPKPSYLYLAFLPSEEGLEVRLLFRLDEAQPDFISRARVHGAFKGLPRVLKTHAAILRWIWASLYDNCRFPPPLLKRSVPRKFLLPWPSQMDCAAKDRLLLDLELCLTGIKPLPEMVLPEEEPGLFLQSVWLRDQVVLNAFFTGSARRLRSLPKTPQHCLLNRALEVEHA